MGDQILDNYKQGLDNNHNTSKSFNISLSYIDEGDHMPTINKKKI